MRVRLSAERRIYQRDAPCLSWFFSSVFRLALRVCVPHRVRACRGDGPLLGLGVAHGGPP